MAQLELDKVSKFFGGLAAINALDMEVDQGEIVGIIGPNGAGKTTTFNVITGELRPSNGSVIFEGQDITGRSPNHVAHLGIVRTFQLATLFPGYTVLENLLVGLHLQSDLGFVEALVNTRSNRRKELALFDRALEVLDFMGLMTMGDEVAENLPHGLQRTLGVAIGLVGAWGVSRVLTSLLYGVSATDPVTYVGTALVLALVAGTASYLPARRASRVDPVEALRGD